LELRAMQQRLEAQNHALQEEVDARRNAEAALRASELHYRRLFETAHDGILLLDLETGRVTDANPALALTVDEARSTMVGRKLWDLAPFKSAPISKRALEDLRGRDQNLHDNWVLETRRGTSVHVEVNCSTHEVSGTTVMQLNLRDITDRK